MDQTVAPILDALAAAERGAIAGFGGPGHSGGRGAKADIVALIGDKAFRANVLTAKGLDDSTESFGIMRTVYELAAWCVDLCRFSTGCSTQSIQTAVAAVCGPGDVLLIAGDTHKAESSIAVLAGVTLVPIPPVIDAFVLDRDGLVRVVKGEVPA